jgi:uncharacterized membrane protein
MGENRSTAIVVADLAIMTVLALWVLAENETAAVVYKAFFWVSVYIALFIVMGALYGRCSAHSCKEPS